MSTSNRAALFSLSFIAVIVTGFAAYIWMALHWSYSEGERAGFIAKTVQKRMVMQNLGRRAVPGCAARRRTGKIQLFGAG